MKHAEQKTRWQALEDALAQQQQRLAEAQLGVIVLVEGWGAAGKGSLIRNLIGPLDPRYFKVVSMPPPAGEEGRWPFLKRYFSAIPPRGKLLFLDSGWMDEAVRERLSGALSEEAYQGRLESIRAFERQLSAGGYLLVKLFLEVDRDTQRRRLRELEADRDTAWRVGEDDWRQTRRDEETRRAMEAYRAATDAPWAPWRVIDGGSEKEARLSAGEWLYGRLAAALAGERPAVPPPTEPFPLLPMPALAQVPLDGALEEGAYRAALKGCRKELSRLHNALYRRKIPLVIVYEGWDAAGKGGNIRRLTSALDPRGYEVIPIAAPSAEELARHYLWRFWTRLPKTGHIAIFDRSWYGRVMVERLEGLCPPEAWQRAYGEINEFERELTDWGAVVVKFWVQIDKDTQLARFRERENTPEKRWKITQEDWRNREKWDAYEVAVDEMLQKTSTRSAPWHILPSVDKRYARIRAMETVIRAIEEALERD